MIGDGTHEGTIVYINDPWQKDMKIFSLPNIGSRYTESYKEFKKTTFISYVGK